MEDLIKLIFGENLPSRENIFNKYKTRNLKNGQKVTRFAPSPTGFIHIGNLYSALVNERVAHISDGIFFLRIEDTDEKREIEGAVNKIINALEYFDIKYDEGTDGINEIGNYAPYKQSDRKEIYKVFIKDLMERGMAYPCFCTEEELENIIKQQKAQNCSRLGYYGNWAKYRNLPIEESIKRIKNGEEYVIRFRSNGNFNKNIVVNDIIRGNTEFPENELDIVIMKKNGLPTYHFAHVVDDFLMGTTTVIRGDEWLPSLPLHIQLFQAMKWKAPKYAHISPLLKIENGAKRKLSKRKDPEANIEYFDQLGYPKESVIEYLLNLANSSFEGWRKQNPEKSYSEFPFDIKKMNVSGALFDFIKLDSVSREVISKMNKQEVYNNVLNWSKKYDKQLESMLSNNKERCLEIFGIERENTKKVRKDIAKWSDTKQEILYFFELDEKEIRKKLEYIDLEEVRKISRNFSDIYDIKDEHDLWFEKLKRIARNLGYADNIKDYKENPGLYKGNISDVAKVLRILVTGREQSPDLCIIMKILGSDETKRRLILIA